MTPGRSSDHLFGEKDVRRVMELAGVNEAEARELLLEDIGPFGGSPDPPLPDSPLGWALAPWEQLLGAAQALTRAGVGWEDLDEKAGDLMEKAEGLRELGMDGEANDLEAVAGRLAVRAHQLRQAETLLVAEGLAFDRRSGRVVVPPGPKGGAPRQLIRDMVRSLLSPLSGLDKKGKRRQLWPLGEPLTTPGEVCDRVSEVLAPYFGVDLLDTSKGSRLHRAVEKTLDAP